MYCSSEIKIGNLYIGGKHPVVVQSMTTTNTMDTEATVRQVKELVDVGCQIVRLTTRNKNEAYNLKNIKTQLVKAGIDVPLVADVHFNPSVAEVAAKFVEKVRINPGNYYTSSLNGENEEIISEKLNSLLSICKNYNTTIRIGVNHGSLSKRILFKYGDTALGMVESLMEFVEVCRRYDFDNLVLSVKTSNVKIMIEANILLAERLVSLGMSCPIHLGVTEAGSEEEGRIKSSAGIGYVLSKGIGDTIRVSLAENPVNEIPVAKLLVEYFGKRSLPSKLVRSKLYGYSVENLEFKKPIIVTTSKTESSDLSMDELYGMNGSSYNSEILKIVSLKNMKLPSFEYTTISSVLASIAFYDNLADGIHLENSQMLDVELGNISKTILQALGLRISGTEYIACPTCGRTTINLVDLLKELKSKTSHIIGLKLAVMGCIVNGLGEMADAHYGIMGAGAQKVQLYKGSSIVQKNVPQNMAVDSLISLIKSFGDWEDVE